MCMKYWLTACSSLPRKKCGIGGTNRPAMTIAVDLGCKATKQTNKTQAEMTQGSLGIMVYNFILMLVLYALMFSLSLILRSRHCSFGWFNPIILKYCIPNKKTLKVYCTMCHVRRKYNSQ